MLDLGMRQSIKVSRLSSFSRLTELMRCVVDRIDHGSQALASPLSSLAFSPLASLISRPSCLAPVCICVFVVK